MNKNQNDSIINAVNQLREHSLANVQTNLSLLAIEIATQPNYDSRDKLLSEGLSSILYVVEFLNELKNAIPFHDTLRDKSINIEIIADIVASHGEMISMSTDGLSDRDKKRTLYDMDQCNNFVEYVNS